MDRDLHEHLDSDLSERRAALLRKRLAQRGFDRERAGAGPQVVRRSDPAVAPLSPGQRRMWVLHRSDPTGCAYNVCLHLKFTGELDVPALRTALHRLVVRHEVLRTRYPLGADRLPGQRIDPAPAEAEFPIPLVDLRDRPDAEADRLVRELAGHRFDLAREWPLRLVLYRTGPDEYRLGLAVHHIAWDGGTWPVISAEITSAYAAAIGARPEAAAGGEGGGSAEPEPLALQYGDFATAQAGAPVSGADRDYWSRQLAGLPGPLPLPADQPGDSGGGRRCAHFDRAATARLTALAAEHAVTPFTVLLAAFATLLHRYGGGVDLPIGSASMNRDDARAQRLVGNFGNTLLLRLNAAGDPGFDGLLRRVHQVCADGFAHQDLSYDQVVAALRERGPAGPDAFNVMLLFLTQGLTGPELPGVHTTWRNVHNGTHQFDLSLEAFLIGGRMEVEATYSAALFSPERVDELLADLRAVLDAAETRPGTRLSEFPVPRRPVLRPERIEDRARTAAGETGTTGEVGELVGALVAEVLELDSVPGDGDFFALGGNSLLATKLVARIRAALGADVSVRTVMLARTPAALAASVVEALAEDGVDPGSGPGAGWRMVARTEPGTAPAPLSVAQHALWFLYQASGPAPDYNVACARELSGPLDVEALRAAVRDLVERHEALRTVVAEPSGGVPEQRILGAAEALRAGAELRVRDGRDLRRHLRRDLEAELGHCFRLDAEPAFRPTLLRAGPDGTEQVLLLLLHHLVADEWSETVLCEDLATAYRARRAGREPLFAPLPVGYSDYARWQRTVLDGPQLATQREFWRATLAGLPEQVALPTDRPRPAEPTGHGDAVSVPLPRPVLAALRGLARRAGTTPFVVWHALAALLLSRNGAGRDIAVGTPVSGRGSTALHGVVGMFVNSVVLRADLTGNPTFAELVSRLAGTDLAAFDHQDLPFERVVDLIDPPRVLGRNPLFQTMVVHDDTPAPRLGLPEVADRPLPARLDIAKFDLSLTLLDGGDRPSATLRYSTALFDRATILRMAAELAVLAGQVAADPDRPLAEIEHLPAAERELMLRSWNDTTAPASDDTLPAMFAARAAEDPDAVAAVCGDRSLTYRELDLWSGQLATELLGRGVGPERTVGIHLDRSLEMVVALLAVQRAGGAFVPLEPAWPLRRIEDTLRTARPVLVLSGDPGALDGCGVPATLVPQARPDAPTAGPPALDPENLAYVMYTSGSTGTPKGAMIRHRAIANRLIWQRGLLGFGPGDAALFKAPLGFDISINEIFLPLVCGAKLVIGEPGLEREVDQLAELIAGQRVTFCYLTSSMLRLLLDTGRGNRLAGLRHVWCGGELLTPELFARFRADGSNDGATLYHGYGPAEATIGVSHEIYREGHRRGAATIGRPNPNTSIYLLDDQLRAVSTGVPGEIYLGGLPLARGYVGEPTRTAERFVADPFGGPGDRLYRTGDLARWRRDGVLEFLGRTDNQIKIRGMRVELEEIESALGRHPGVRHAAVRSVDDGPATRLVGYQVPDEVTGPDGTRLRDWLTGQLPAHMVPDTIVTLPALPMLPSGKIDRSALPVPPRRRAGSRPPRGFRETLLCELFAEALGLAEVGAEDDFFTLGGDSILSIQLVSALRSAGLRATVRDLFAAPTPAGLAPRLTELVEAAPAAPVPHRRELPLSPLQRGLAFHSLADQTEADAYIAQLVLGFAGSVSADQLRAALDAVVARHESLRAAFRHEGRREPVQVVAERVTVPWRELDLRGEPDPELAWTRLRATERATRFALDRAPLLRAVLARVGEREHRLLLTNHHLLFDGWSLPLLVRDLLAAYPDGTLPAAAGQYSDYLDWLATRDVEAARRAWRSALDGVSGPTLLAGSPDGSAEPPYQPSAELALRIGPELTAAITALARESGVTLNTALMGAWGLLLGVLTGEDDVLFGFTVSGRPAELAGADSTVGLFINTVVARVATDPGESFRELLRRLHGEQVELLDHQHLGLADVQREAGLGEVFDTLLVFESYPVRRDQLDAAAERAGLRVSGTDSGDDTHYPLTVLVSPGDDLGITLKYRSSVFTAERVELLGRRLCSLLRQLTARPDRSLAGLDPLLPGETSRWQVPPVVPAEGGDDDLVEDIARTARRFPERTALRFEDRTLSYREFDTAVERLAGRLREHGAGPEQVVGVAVPRSIELVVALHAVLRAGAAFLPLDPDQPAVRLHAMLSEADPVVVLSTVELPTGVPVLRLDDKQAPQAPQAGGEGRAAAPDHPAYVIYTSGSTGTPKGAVLTRAGLRNRLRWMAGHYGFDQTDVLLQKTPAGFDVSVWEFFLPFLVGAELVVARPDGHRDPGYLAGLIRRTGVSTVHFVPSMLRAFLAEPGVSDCRSLRRVLCSGEALPSELAARCTELLETELHNLYGPTEASIDVTATRYRGGPGSGVPIGRAIDGVTLRVLDAALRPVPPGVPGELYLGGVQLARGYLRRPALTASRFVASEQGERLYRTGDIVRALPDGQLEFLGRTDDQVKIRGVRVEPGETEAALLALPGVASAAVLARDDGPSGSWLVGYVVPRDDRTGAARLADGRSGAADGAGLDPEVLREQLAARLPDQFVPGAIVLLQRLPLTSSGKLDRRALPAPDRDREATGRAPEGPVQTLLCELFADVLGLDRVGADGNFFALGGDSISALRLASLARPAGLAFSPRQVFEAKTPAALALLAEPAAPALADLDPTGDVPLTPIMHRLLDRGGPFRSFSQSVLLRTPAGITREQLDAGLRALLTAHHMLRARLVNGASLHVPDAGDGGADDGVVTVPLHRIAGLPDADRIPELAHEQAAALDPAAGGMLRAVWFDAGPDRRGRLLLVAHHLVVDGVSWRILVGDLAEACQGRPPAPVATSFRAWAKGLVAAAPGLADELAGWRAALDGTALDGTALDGTALDGTALDGTASRLGRRAIDPERDVLAHTERLVVRLPAEHTTAVLTSLPATLRAQTQDVLLAALATALAGEGLRAPLVRLEGHGREEELVPGADLTRTVGWFTSAFPVRLDATGVDPAEVLAGGAAGGTLVKRIREMLRGLPHRGAGYGVLRHLSADGASALAGADDPAIGFNYLGRFDTGGPGAATDWSLDASAFGGGGDPDMPVAHAVDVNVLVDEQGVRASWTYLPEVVAAEVVSRLARRWVDALCGLVRHGERPDASGPSPEDLGLVQVSAGQLDRLRRRLET